LIKRLKIKIIIGMRELGVREGEGRRSVLQRKSKRAYNQ
jgi:hypothetical protein